MMTAVTVKTAVEEHDGGAERWGGEWEAMKWVRDAMWKDGLGVGRQQ